MNKANDSTAFQIEWDLHELGPKTASQPVVPEPDISSRLDFSRLDYGRAVAAGYLPANERRFSKDRAA